MGEADSEQSVPRAQCQRLLKAASTTSSKAFHPCDLSVLVLPLLKAEKSDFD